MTLRVTHVLRRIDNEWRLVHRHADSHPPTSAVLSAARALLRTSP